ncbi:cucumisin-like [Morus notabilis]|uniref:cucumisin-like n=1 Tax=Morus notabilis TaxID=981085 RepID=UPI000CED595A|nr:cucumisin-like [Morus notabilis]
MAFSWILLLSLTLTLLSIHHSAAQDERKPYIVYMGDLPKDEVSTSPLHFNMLQKVIDKSHIVAGSLLRSYKRSFNGFAAKLTKEEAQKMARMEGVVSVFPNRKKKLHTTRSWNFIGFPQQVKRSTVESDIIIGMFDSGIWPESSSFDDKGFGPPPSKWKGTCEVPSNFTCNNKIIGAKYYRSIGEYRQNDIKSPRDSGGHGTHTASTAAGAAVGTASLSGFAHGTARGGVPSARLAVYKICWNDEECYDVDILAAFDDAIADGVDIISASLGGFDPDNYFTNSIAIGSLHAVRKGILTSVSAGNGGPSLASVTNFSPWILSVAASTIDRQFFTKVQLGDHKIYEGISINTFDLNNKTFPLIYGGDFPNKTKGDYELLSRYCEKNSLDKNRVKGKIVFCDRISDSVGQEAFRAGAAGVIFQGRLAGDVVNSFALPATYLSVRHAAKIYMYMNSTRKPIASIWRSTEARNRLAPYIPAFSSRGPNPVSPNILKPDLAAPGVQILAAWSPIAPISFVLGDERTEAYNIITGTSMACPHASAAAAYVKSFHPSWSPAAIKSSLMTTAHPMSTNLNPEGEFAYGSGQINPVKALSPGLLYDVEEIDYVKFLCGQGYDTKTLRIITADKSSCSLSEEINGSARDLNYPAFALTVSSSESVSHVFSRTVTNVGSPNSTYKANLAAPEGLKITVKPSVLRFTSVGQKLSYELKVKGIVDKFVESASLVWDDGIFQVRSPIAIYLEY